MEASNDRLIEVLRERMHGATGSREARYDAHQIAAAARARRGRRHTAVGLLTVLSVAATAVGVLATSREQGSAPEAAADCQAQVRLDGRVYTSYGYTDRAATKFSVADRAQCRDVGNHATGSVFADDPTQVTVWSFDGYPTEQVLGVRFDTDSFAVFVADSVSRPKSDRIYDELRRHPK